MTPDEPTVPAPEALDEEDDVLDGPDADAAFGIPAVSGEAPASAAYLRPEGDEEDGIKPVDPGGDEMAGSDDDWASIEAEEDPK